MKEISVFNLKGDEVGKVELIPEVFEVSLNGDLVHQVILAQKDNSRKNIADTKDRSERRGGGKKPWQQKGTGRARHGSSRSPIWRKGGITFGPTSLRNFTKKVNKKAKQKALAMILSGKLNDNELLIVDSFKIEQLKTKIAVDAIKNLKAKAEILKESKAKDKFIIVLAKEEKDSTRAIKNIPYISTISVDSLNVIDILSNKYLVVTQKALLVIQEKK